MYEFVLRRSRHNPVPKDVEDLIDKMMIKPFIKLPDRGSCIRLGRYATELKNKGILKFYYNKENNETIACLTINNHIKPNSISKQTGKIIKYIFTDTLPPKNYLELL